MKIIERTGTNVDYLMQRYKVSSLCAKILSCMDLDEPTMDSCLSNSIDVKRLDVPFLSPILERIELARKRGEKILICGDYDCDGICATTILYDALQRAQVECGYYIPNRFKEGYGLHVNTVELAHKKGYSLLVTVDNGVKAVEALQRASAYKIDIILTDHHNYEEEDIVCDYFLHPRILPAMYAGMCGAGLAFLLSYGLLGFVEEHAILAGVATIGDMVPLRLVNRALVCEAIALLNQNKLSSIQCLSADQEVWSASKIAFQVVPKLNSVGRLADRANANNVVAYLASKNQETIQSTAQQINALNNERKDIGARMEECARRLVNADDDFIIVYDDTFHEGINGIVASKFVREFDKPVMVLSKSEGVLKGSVRSNSVDLTHFFDPIQDQLLRFGGHKEAAGLSFEESSLASIRAFANKAMKDVQVDTHCRVLLLSQEDISIESIQSISALEPFGNGFEKPLILVKDHDLKLSLLTHGKHIKYEGENITYLYFSQGSRMAQDSKRNEIKFIGHLTINQFRNKQSINMIVERIVE